MNYPDRSKTLHKILGLLVFIVLAIYFFEVDLKNRFSKTPAPLMATPTIENSLPGLGNEYVRKELFSVSTNEYPKFGVDGKERFYIFSQEEKAVKVLDAEGVTIRSMSITVSARTNSVLIDKKGQIVCVGSSNIYVFDPNGKPITVLDATDRNGLVFDDGLLYENWTKQVLLDLREGKKTFEFPNKPNYKRFQVRDKWRVDYVDAAVVDHEGNVYVNYRNGDLGDGGYVVYDDNVNRIVKCNAQFEILGTLPPLDYVLDRESQDLYAAVPQNGRWQFVKYECIGKQKHETQGEKGRLKDAEYGFTSAMGQNLDGVKGKSGLNPPGFHGYVNMSYFNTADISVTFEMETANESEAKTYIYLMVPSELKLNEGRLSGKLVERFEAGSSMKLPGLEENAQLDSPTFKIELDRKTPNLYSGSANFDVLVESKGVLRAWMTVGLKGVERPLTTVSRGENVSCLDVKVQVPKRAKCYRYIAVKPETKKLFDYALEKVRGRGLNFFVMDDLFGVLLHDFDQDGKLDVLLNASGVEVGESHRVKCYEQHIWYFHRRGGEYKSQEVFSELNECALVNCSVLRDELTGEPYLRIDCGKYSYGSGREKSRLYRLTSGELLKVLEFDSNMSFPQSSRFETNAKCKDGLFYVDYDYSYSKYDHVNDRYLEARSKWQNIYKPDLKTGKGLLLKGQHLADFQKQNDPDRVEQ